MDLIYAAREGDTDECERLLLCGANPNSSNGVCALCVVKKNCDKFWSNIFCSPPQEKKKKYNTTLSGRTLVSQ